MDRNNEAKLKADLIVAEAMQKPDREGYPILLRSCLTNLVSTCISVTVLMYISDGQTERESSSSTVIVAVKVTVK